MPKKKKEGRSWGLIFSLLLHGSIVLLVLVWGINRYTASNLNEPINVSLSGLDFKGSAPDGGDEVKSVKAKKPEVKPEEPKKEEKPDIKEEPKKEVVEKEEPKEEEPEKEEVVEKEEPIKEEPKKEEVVEKEEPDKKIVALEEEKVVPKEEVKKEPKKESKKEEKKEVKKKKEKPKEKKDDSKTARNNVINDLKRKSVIEKLGISENNTKTASAKESPGL